MDLENFTVMLDGAGIPYRVEQSPYRAGNSVTLHPEEEQEAIFYFDASGAMCDFEIPDTEDPA